MRSYLVMELIAAIYLAVAVLAAVEDRLAGAAIFTAGAGFYLLRAVIKYEKEKNNATKSWRDGGPSRYNPPVGMRDGGRAGAGRGRLTG